MHGVPGLMRGRAQGYEEARDGRGSVASSARDVRDSAALPPPRVPSCTVLLTFGTQYAIVYILCHIILYARHDGRTVRTPPGTGTGPGVAVTFTGELCSSAHFSLAEILVLVGGVILPARLRRQPVLGFCKAETCSVTQFTREQCSAVTCLTPCNVSC